ncbi:unnamed protein product [Acanthoscelides obtectus]|uniref:Uncharacterized protein n=1 Tax=Acanthoscelides obtectus TaxID=200917 RepID=A0A9P0JWU9_ACAOB|nr:unnamed protein product [Acanthoscelides obtectus]CAK1639022.1 hypothetical protein AOBTE_LOCUS10954 [Acanthoscelides obtectus]
MSCNDIDERIRERKGFSATNVTRNSCGQIISPST